MKIYEMSDAVNPVQGECTSVEFSAIKDGEVLKIYITDKDGSKRKLYIGLTNGQRLELARQLLATLVTE